MIENVSSILSAVQTFGERSHAYTPEEIEASKKLLAQNEALQQRDGRAADQLNGIKLDPSKQIADVGGLVLTPEQIEANNTAMEGKLFTREAQLEPITYDRASLISTSNEYMVNGVLFSGKEYQAAVSFMDGMAQAMKEAGALTTGVGYDDYAMMGLTSAHLKSFMQKQGFSQEQCAVLWQDYTNFLSDAVALRKPGGTQTAIGDMGKYWLQTTAGGVTALHPDVASNQELMSGAMRIFGSVDVNSGASLQNALEQYRALVRPAYAALDGAGTYSLRSERLADRLQADQNAIQSLHGLLSGLMDETLAQSSTLNVQA